MARFLRFAAVFIITAFLVTVYVLAQQEPYAKVIYVSGKAQCLSSGARSWEILKTGKKLYAGDNVKTYGNSSADITFDEGNENIATIRENTEIIIRLKDKEKIELVSGEVYAFVRKLGRGSQFEVRTPTAVCGARGTGWGANALKGRTIVSAYRNDSYAKGINKDGTVMEDNMTVKEGYKTEVKLFQEPALLERLTSREMEGWEKWEKHLASITRSLSQEDLKGDKFEEVIEKFDKQKENIEELHDDRRFERIPEPEERHDHDGWE